MENKVVCGTFLSVVFCFVFWGVFLYHSLTLRTLKRSPKCKTTLKIFLSFSKILELTQKVYVKRVTLLTLWLRVLSQKWTARAEVHLHFWNSTAGWCISLDAPSRAHSHLWKTALWGLLLSHISEFRSGHRESSRRVFLKKWKNWL